MSYILHVSDFHLTDDPSALEKLQKLSDFIKSNNYKIDYLVHTGDFIDSKTAYEEAAIITIKKYKKSFKKRYKYSEETFENEIKRIANSTPSIIDEFNEELIKTSTEKFNIAEKAFKNLINNLQIDISKVVICCGNHDKIRLIEMVEDESKCSDFVFEESKNDKKKFNLYTKFCSNMKISESIDSRIVDFSDFKVLILNTNYVTPIFKGNCINCSQITEIIKNESFNSKNLIISHKPCHEYCENYILSYEKDSHTAKIHELTSFSKTILCGDKHTVGETSYAGLNMFVCGAPLSSKELIYNLLHFNEENETYQCEYLCYQNETWICGPTDETCNRILDLSKDYISDTTKEIIHDISIDSFKKFKQIDTASELFKSVCKFKNDDSVGQWGEEDSIFEQFYKMIFSNKEVANPINIKGHPGVGKSCFLGLEYLYLLDLFKKGLLRYIPVYFNANYVVGSGSIKDSIKNKFTRFFKDCNDMSSLNNLPIFYIIDGLDDKECIDSEESVERFIYQTIHDNSNKYIFSFNQYKFPNMNSSINIEYEINNSVIYFNPVDIMSLGTKRNRFNAFVESYLKLQNINDDETIEIVKGLLMKYRKINLNLVFLHTNFSYLINRDNSKKDGWQVLNDYRNNIESFCNQKFGHDYEKKLPYATYLLSYEGYTFSDLEDKDLISDYNIFKEIKKLEDVRNYLIAVYYCQQIKEYAINQKKEIDNSTIFYKFIPRDIGVLIRLQMEKLGNHTYLLNKLVDKLDDTSISVPLYIISHMRIPDIIKSEYLDLCKNRKNFNLTSPILINQLNNKEDFIRCSSKRTYLISNTICDDPNKIIYFIHELINNKDLRLFNRLYQMLYYGDLTINGEDNRKIVTPNKDIIHKGFDFHNIFHVLVSKLEYNFRLKQRYYLMEFDLFTICDIAYSRIQRPFTYINGKQIETFFYYSGYNDEYSNIAECVLDRLIKSIETYIKDKNTYNFELKETDSVYVYFKYMLQKFKEYKELLIKVRKNEIDKRFLMQFSNPEHELLSLINLKSTNRIGWNINKAQEHNEEKRIKLNKGISKESILEHVFESMCIALLYLPEQISKDDISNSLSEDEFIKIKQTYDKGKVLNYIFLHEFGKRYTKDFTPDSAKISELQKIRNQDLLSLLILGSVDNYGGMHEYFKVFENEIENSNNDINYLISQDINFVQREYKLETLKLFKKIVFDEDRLNDFRNSSKITTNIGFSILKMLVKDNPKFFTQE